MKNKGYAKFVVQIRCIMGNVEVSCSLFQPRFSGSLEGLSTDGRYFIYDYYYVPKHSYYILLYIIIITL